MTKQNTKEQITNIDEQIKRLKEKQKRILTNSQKDIGKYLMETWGVDDVKEAKSLIDSLKDQVKSFREVASSEDKQNKEDFKTSLSNSLE